MNHNKQTPLTVIRKKIKDMSKSIIKIRRKSDNKILFDVINDACQVHNIYDDGKLIGSFKEWEIGYMCNDFFKDSPYEEIKSITEDEWNAMVDAYDKSIYKELITPNYGG